MPPRHARNEDVDEDEELLDRGDDDVQESVEGTSEGGGSYEDDDDEELETSKATGSWPTSPAASFFITSVIIAGSLLAVTLVSLNELSIFYGDTFDHLDALQNYAVAKSLQSRVKLLQFSDGALLELTGSPLMVTSAKELVDRVQQSVDGVVSTGNLTAVRHCLNFAPDLLQKKYTAAAAVHASIARQEKVRGDLFATFRGAAMTQLPLLATQLLLELQSVSLSLREGIELVQSMETTVGSQSGSTMQAAASSSSQDFFSAEFASGLQQLTRNLSWTLTVASLDLHMIEAISLKTEEAAQAGKQYARSATDEANTVRVIDTINGTERIVKQWISERSQGLSLLFGNITMTTNTSSPVTTNATNATGSGSMAAASPTPAPSATPTIPTALQTDLIRYATNESLTTILTAIGKLRTLFIASRNVLVTRQDEFLANEENIETLSIVDIASAFTMTTSAATPAPMAIPDSAGTTSSGSVSGRTTTTTTAVPTDEKDTALCLSSIVSYIEPIETDTIQRMTTAPERLLNSDRSAVTETRRHIQVVAGVCLSSLGIWIFYALGGITAKVRESFLKYRSLTLSSLALVVLIAGIGATVSAVTITTIQKPMTLRTTTEEVQRTAKDLDQVFSVVRAFTEYLRGAVGEARAEASLLAMLSTGLAQPNLTAGDLSSVGISNSAMSLAGFRNLSRSALSAAPLLSLLNAVATASETPAGLGQQLLSNKLVYQVFSSYYSSPRAGSDTNNGTAAGTTASSPSPSVGNTIDAESWRSVTSQWFGQVESFLKNVSGNFSGPVNQDTEVDVARAGSCSFLASSATVLLSLARYTLAAGDQKANFAATLQQLAAVASTAASLCGVPQLSLITWPPIHSAMGSTGQQFQSTTDSTTPIPVQIAQIFVDPTNFLPTYSTGFSTTQANSLVSQYKQLDQYIEDRLSALQSSIHSTTKAWHESKVRTRRLLVVLTAATLLISQLLAYLLSFTLFGGSLYNV